MRIETCLAIDADADTVGTLVWTLLTELDPASHMAVAEAQAVARSLLGEGASVFGLLARVDDEPVGVLMLNECASIYARGRFGEITELFVAPEFRSCGVAKHLVAHARQFGLERGWKRLEVGAPHQPDWHRTVDFYRREGFVHVGPRLKLPID